MAKSESSKSKKAAPSRRTKRSKLALPEVQSLHNSESTPNAVTKPARRVSDSNLQEENDAHEAQWWKIHVDKATTLINKCAKAYDWDKSTARRVLTSYRHFLMVKKEAEDWFIEAKLEPCWSVDRMWQQHCEMEDYSFDTETLCMLFDVVMYVQYFVIY
jgi:hypothetical protein